MLSKMADTLFAEVLDGYSSEISISNDGNELMLFYPNDPLYGGNDRLVEVHQRL